MLVLGKPQKSYFFSVPATKPIKSFLMAEKLSYTRKLLLVLMLDVNLEHDAHAWRKIGLLEEQKSDLWLLDLIKCLKQNK